MAEVAAEVLKGNGGEEVEVVVRMGEDGEAGFVLATGVDRVEEALRGESCRGAGGGMGPTEGRMGVSLGFEERLEAEAEAGKGGRGRAKSGVPLA